MNLTTVYFGFHAPGFRNAEGKIDPRCWLGHVEVWGYTEDNTWVFIDPAGAGLKITAIHRYDDVLDAITIRMNACACVMRLPGETPKFALPLHGLMTCASVAGQLASVRALLPATLRAKLLRKGAEIVHEKPENAERGPADQD